jgi:hypothetical protein
LRLLHVELEPPLLEAEVDGVDEGAEAPTLTGGVGVGVEVGVDEADEAEGEEDPDPEDPEPVEPEPPDTNEATAGPGKV